MPFNTIFTMHFIHDITGEGWRESIPTNQSVAGLVTVGDGVVANRAKCLDASCHIFAWSAHNPGPPKANYIRRFDTPVSGGLGVIAGVDEPGTCLVYRLYDALGHTRQYPIRGINDAFVANQKLTPAGSLAKGFFDGWVQSLVAGPWGFNIVYSGSTKIPIVSIISAAPGAEAVCTTVTAHGLQPGDICKITRVKDSKFANAYWRVGAPFTTTTFTMLGSGKMSFDTFWPGNVQKVSPTFQAYTGQTFTGPSFRKTGKPSFQQRGKSSARVVHQ